jgi:hypothetical protein
MTTSPLVTGGAGFDFEDAVAAVYLSGLLLQTGVLGLGQFTVSLVALQRASSGAPLDDVIVTGVSATGETAKLHLQVKSTLQIGDSPTNTDFRDVVTKAWATLRGGDFKEGRDRVGAGVGSISQKRLKALRRIQEIALNSATADDFWDRFDGVTNQEARNIRDSIMTVLKELDPRQADSQRVWRFFQHFVVLQFDLHETDGKDAFYAVEQLKSALKPEAAGQATHLWRKLVEVAKNVGDAGGSVGRKGLLERLTPEFPLEAARSAKADLERLAAIAKACLADIRLDVSGYRLHRSSITEKISVALAGSRFVQITGEPGTGKSAVLRSMAESDERNGFIFVLSEKRIEGNGWVGFAAANGLTSSSAAALLTEIGASANPILFIDGIDRIVVKSAQQVVADILRTIATEPGCAKWRVVASVRDENIEHVRTWIPAEFLSQTGVASIEVGLFNDDEAAQIGKALPVLAPLLNAVGPAREIARRPFFLRVLGEGIARQGGGSAPQSEIELIDAWWSRGGYDATRADARRRQQVLLTAAEKGVLSFGRKIDALGLDATAVQDLVEDSVIRDVEPGITIGFTHDVFFEWSLFQLARSRGDSWLDLVKDAGEPPFWGRIVSLLSQRAFERDEGWQRGLEGLETASARSQWRRAWLIAPFASPLFSTYQARFDGAFHENPDRLRRLLLGFQAEKTQPNPLVLGGFAGNDLDRLARLRLADQLSWPSDLLAWSRFLKWFLPQCGDLPPALVSEALPVFEAWITAFGQNSAVIPIAMKQAIANWLTAIEAHRHPESVRDILTRNYKKGWGAISDDELREVERSLRFQFFMATKSDPELQRAYFQHLCDMGDRIREGAAFIAEYAPLIHAAAIPKAVDVCIEAFLDELPEDEERNRSPLGGGRGVLDWDQLSLGEGGASFFPPSPAREPFKTFFQTTPQEALRLTRAICNHAMEAWRQLNALDVEYGRRPRALVIKFPWGEQEFWGNIRVYGFYRGINGPHLLDSALMALEEWAFSELENGRSADDIILDTAKENKCCAVLGIALEIAIQSNSTTNVSLALLGSAHLWLWDIGRGKADLVNLRQNEFGFTIGSQNKAQHEALRKANGRAVRRQNIQTLAMMFVVGQNTELREAAKAAIKRLPEGLPYECEEDANSPDATAYLAEEAKSWTLLADPSHYRLYKTDEPDKVAIGFENPEASSPKRIARANAAQESLSWFALEANVQKILNGEQFPTSFSLPEAIAKVQKEDATALLNSESDDPLVAIKQGAVVGVAAVVAKNHSSVQPEEIEWAKQLLQEGATRSYRLDERTNPGSILTHHPGSMAAKGLSYLILGGIDERWAKETLLRLMLHPLEAVYESAVASCLACWARDSRFSWIGFCLGLALANQDSGPDDWKNPEVAATRRNADREKRLDNALAALKDETSTWMQAPAPTALTAELEDDAEKWRVSRAVRPLFRYDLAGRVIRYTPIESIVQSHEAKELLLRLADRLLAWTMSANPPERRVAGRRVSRPTPPYEWTRLFMTWLAYLCSVLPSDLSLSRYTNVVLAIDDDDACFELLDSFVDHLVCRQIHDAEELSPGTLALVKAIADRVAAADWRWDASRVNGNLTRQKHTILKALLLVNVAQADGARRFANGNWSEIAAVIPSLEKLFQSIASVTGGLLYFLNLAERSIDHYPAEALAGTLMNFLVAQENKPAALRSISAPEQMAALVQTIAAREHPLSENLRAKLLKLLDMLVELGDRRSAALLGSEWFKTVRRVSA